MSDMNPYLLEGLRAVVQYCRKDGRGTWSTIAAFDHESVAEHYAKKCGEGDVPWEYRVLPLYTPSPSGNEQGDKP